MDNNIEMIELSIREAKKKVDMASSLEKLRINKDFDELITEGYFVHESSRLVLLKADPSMSSDNDQIIISKSIDAIGYFRQYLSAVRQLGSMASKAISDDEDTREEMLREAI